MERSSADEDPGSLIRAEDWSTSALGPRDRWPAALRLALDLCLASAQPAALAWGRDRVLVYNDAYRSLCGIRHPHVRGSEFTSCWKSAWGVIGEPFARAVRGESVFLQDQRMFLDRTGRLEEVFLSFALSPIRDETGAVGGVLHTVTDTTATALSRRRNLALRALALAVGAALTVDDVLRAANRTLRDCKRDVPFVLVYALDGDRSRASLVARSGVEDDTGLSRAHVDVDGAGPAWPLGAAVRAGSAVSVDIAATGFAAPPCGPYADPPRTAVLFPVAAASDGGPCGVVIAGVSSRLELDEGYRAFYDEVADTIRSALTGVRARSDERSLRDDLERFIRVLGHDLRNSVSAISTAACLVMRRAGAAENLVKPTDRIVATADRMERIIAQTMDASSIRTGQGLGLEPEPLDLAELCRQTVQDVAHAYQPLPHVTAAGDTHGTWDRDRLAQAVSTLVLNACIHGTKGSPVEVVVDGTGHDTVRIEAHSHGTIPRSELAALFDRPPPADGAARRPGASGLGLGLFILRAIVHAHGGTVAVSSEDDAGTRFTLTLPRGRSATPRRGT